MSDLISRRAALNAIDEYDFEFPNYMERFVTELRDAMKADLKSDIEALPSAQPEIIRCKDCEYGEQDEVGRWFCRSLGCQVGNQDGSGYCADAERREEDG